MSVDWSYYDKKEFDEINDKYLPMKGEGETRATQIVTAVNKLVYKWYNDGDVYDNTYALDGWCNDISSYANWLAAYAGADDILSRISDIKTGDEYEYILKDLADRYFNMEMLDQLNTWPKVGSVYTTEGSYVFDEHEDDEDNYGWEEEEDEEEEDGYDW